LDANYSSFLGFSGFFLPQAVVWRLFFGHQLSHKAGRIYAGFKHSGEPFLALFTTGETR
jgi:hypothetical protein